MRKTTFLKSLLLLCALIVGSSSAWAADDTIVFGNLGLENGVQYSDPFDGGNFTVTFAGGGNDGKYYNTGSGIRVYGGGTMTIAAKSGKLATIEVTYDGTNKPTSSDVVDGGTYDTETGTWTGSASSVVFTRPSGSGHWRVKSIAVTYETSGDTPKVATPTFSPAAGAVISGTKVTITCATDRATIYYTTDGTEPNNTSELCGHSPITLIIDKATTIKAKAYYEEMTPSDVATAEYTILPQKSITDVRAQETGEVYTEGVCTSVNGKTAYIQDLGAAIAIYNSAANLDVKAGDKFYVQGTLGTYNGLLQIQNPVITEKHDGYDIPVEEMTIAQVNENATAKQGWYVQIEGAIVTAINSQNVTIKQGENTVVVRYNSTPEDIAIGDAITVKGNIGCFNSTIQIANPTVTVTGLSVTIPSSLYLTFASTKSIDFTGSGITAYTAKAMNKVVVISEIEGNIVPANAGVLLKADAAGTYPGAFTEGGSALSEDNELIGVTVETVVPWESGDKRNYILQSGKFYKANGLKLRAGRAYLSSTYDITASDARLDIVIDGETNAIANVRSQMEDVRGIFNLQGQRVEKAQKGLYIVNGKKVLVK